MNDGRVVSNFILQAIQEHPITVSFSCSHTQVITMYILHTSSLYNLGCRCTLTCVCVVVCWRRRRCRWLVILRSCAPDITTENCQNRSVDDMLLVKENQSAFVGKCSYNFTTCSFQFSRQAQSIIFCQYDFLKACVDLFPKPDASTVLG